MIEQIGADSKSAENKQERKLYIETYGCQMNVADSEVVASVMQMDGYSLTDNVDEADTILVNTCSVRDNAEQKVLNRLAYYHSLRKKRRASSRLVIGVLGCMAERVKEELIREHHVDVVAGPDSYLDLPNLVGAAEQGEKAINVELSTQETYKDVMPLKMGGVHINGFVSIIRGCNNFCSYCIVPYTRGRERSREIESILNEVRDLKAKNFREVTLLGQNVNSYRYEQNGRIIRFPDLLAAVAEAVPDMRIRFTSPHPKDMDDEAIAVMARYRNICNHIHLPAQSGSDKMLRVMKRGYTRRWYCRQGSSYPPGHTGLRHQQRPLLWLPFGDGGRLRSHSQPDGRGRLRLCLHVQILRTAGYLCCSPPCGRCTRRSKACPSGSDDSPPESPERGEQQEGHRQDFRSADRGLQQTIARTAIRPHSAK